MSLPILIDMNLSPAWVEWFDAHGWLAVHWSPSATRVQRTGPSCRGLANTATSSSPTTSTSAPFSPPRRPARRAFCNFAGET